MDPLKLFKQARAAVSMLSADEMKKRAERPISIGLVADGSGAYAEMEEFLVPEGTSRNVRRARMAQVYRAYDPGVPSSVDLVLYEPGIPCPSSAFTFHRQDPSVTVNEILREKADLAMALGRQFPAFRKPVIDGIILEVAKENALFAVATAVPNIVPNLIEIPWIFGEFASDTVFLTANQVRMALQIAAVCGRHVGLIQQKGQLLTIAASAFGWRALARELVSHIPLGGGLVPKAAIAYAGTFAVGKALEFHHYGSRQPSPDDRKKLYQQGLEQGRAFAENLPTASSRA